jgi:hypothetical protein
MGVNDMTYTKGDTVRIRTREQIEALEKAKYAGLPSGTKRSYAIVGEMLCHTGKTATIMDVCRHEDIYRLDVDGGVFVWEEWMFDPDYTGDKSLSPEDAIRAMLGGETLYSRYKVIEKWNGAHFVCQILGNQEWHLKPQDGVFTGLYRLPPKYKRWMTKAEMRAWAESDESFGWRVRHKDLPGSWQSPRRWNYTENIYDYECARLLYDLSGIDESTIQGFEVEEE